MGIYITVADVLGVLFVTWLLVCLIGHGTANTLDQIAYMLHRGAKSIRKMHGDRTEVVVKRWSESIKDVI